MEKEDGKRVMRKRKIQGRARYCAGEGRTRRRDRKNEKRKKCVNGYGNSLTATGRDKSDRNEKDDEQNKKDTQAKGKK